MTPYVVLAAVAWAVATRGGTSPRDLAVVLALLAVATVTSRAWPRRDLPLAAALLALLGWLLATGPLRTGPTVESARVLLLVVVVVLTVRVARRLDLDERERLLTGLVVVGCLHAVVALAELAVALSGGPSYPPRAASLLGSPNGLGMLLVATSVLSAREVRRRGGFLPTAALLLQGCAIFATGSRTALVVAASLLLGYAVTRPGWRVRGLAAAAVVATIPLFVWRLATEPPEQRLHLWRQALDRIADRPLLGEGPPVAAYDISAAGARVTTHAHNEVLQWGVEHGLVGIGLGLLVVGLALRSARPLGHGDRWVLVAAASLLAAGLTDFTLRITALTLVAAALAALAIVPGATVRQRSTSRPSSTSTVTEPPSTTSAESSIRARGSPMADWISRRSGRAPYAGS